MEYIQLGKIVIHAQDLRILKSLGFEDPEILRIIGSSNPYDVFWDKWIISRLRIIISLGLKDP